MHEAHERLTSVLAAALRGDGACPPACEWPAVLERAQHEGVLPLLSDAAIAASWDPRVIAAMRPLVAAEAALAIIRERELTPVLASLSARDVTPLLIKGAHLALTLYASPDRRPRVDTDLLIADRDRDAADAALAACGYARDVKVDGDVAFGQSQYSRIDRSGARHTIDLHWRIANPKAFCDRLTYADLRADAIALPHLGANVLVPSPVFALLIACLHRTAHHGTCMRLIWLYDIHLLTQGLSEAEWEDVVTQAARRGLSATVVAGVDAAASMFGAWTPPETIDRLRLDAAVTDADVQTFLDRHPAKIDVALSDWKRLTDWPTRARFLREHLFPSPLYMRQHYSTASHAVLPLLYAHRIVTGGVKWLRRVE